MFWGIVERPRDDDLAADEVQPRTTGRHYQRAVRPCPSLATSLTSYVSDHTLLLLLPNSIDVRIALASYLLRARARIKLIFLPLLPP
jgi:hypothetical protein